MNLTYVRTILVLLLCGVPATNLYAQTEREIEFRTTRVRDNVYMLAGAGGNIGVSVGDDGVMLIDSEYAGLTDKLIAAVKSISDRPIRFVVNTHWHFDHVGGNEKLAKAGAVIVAHANVRKRMSTEQYLRGIDRRVPPSPPGALPTVTYAEHLTFHWNGDEVSIVHSPPAHTDGDSIIFFRNANVLHVGDICFAGMYPFIDVNAGGSINGMIEGVDRALALANEDTRIIPGHGPLSDVAALRSYRQMFVTVRDRVSALIGQGKSREEVVASRPTSDLDAKWSGGMPPDLWVGVVYDGLKRD